MLGFCFHFAGKRYSVNLNILPDPTPLIFSLNDLDEMRLVYQTYQKTVDRPEDRFVEKVEMRNFLPLLIFPKYGFFSKVQI